MKRTFIAVTSTIAAVTFSQLALSQIDIRGRGVTGDVNQTNQSTTQRGSGNQATTQQGANPQATTQEGARNHSTTQRGTDNQSITQQGARDQTVQQNRSGAGPTDDPNVTRDALGREHENKGLHKGWENKDQRQSLRDDDRSRRN